MNANLTNDNTSPLAAKVLSQTSTKIQALRRLRILKEFLNFKIFDSPEEKDFSKLVKIFESNFMEKSIKEENSILEGEKQRDFYFVESLGEEFFQLFNNSNITLLLKEIEDSIYKTKTIILYLPFEIPDEEISILGTKIKKSFGTNTLIDFKFDPSLIAGCAISYKGVYKDFSLKQKLQDNKQNIIDTLTSYKTQTAPQRQRQVLTQK